MDVLRECTGFDWDAGNSDKNWERHRVADTECEELFFNEPLVVRRDSGHSQREVRYYALGQTDQGRCLFVVFTLRGTRVRVIPARDVNRKERRIYQAYETKKGDSQV
jgi:hypothetical protein